LQGTVFHLHLKLEVECVAKVLKRERLLPAIASPESVPRQDEEGKMPLVWARKEGYAAVALLQTCSSSTMPTRRLLTRYLVTLNSFTVT
jgi:hypothetical protein